MRALFGLFRFLHGKWHLMAWSLAFVLVATGLNLAQPKLLEWAVDFGVGTARAGSVLIGALGILLAGLASGALHMGSGVLLVKSGQTLGMRLRNALFRKTQEFSFGNIDKWRTGELLNRVNGDVETVRRFMRMGLLLMVQSVVMLVGSLVLMFITNARLAVVMLILLPGMLVLFLILASVIRPMIKRVRERLDEVNNVLQENLAGAKVVRAFARQAYEKDRFRTRNTAYMKSALRVGYIMSFAFPFLFFLGQLAIVVASWLGGLQVIEGLLNPSARSLTLGQLLAFNNYALQAMWPILALGMVMQFVTRATASAERIEELLAVAPEVDGESSLVAAGQAGGDAVANAEARRKRLNGLIEFRNVSFSYGAGEAALSEVSFTVAGGETVGILGRTGSGKSTLAYLIPRLYDPSEGSLLIDGIDAREQDLATIRRQVTLILQESVLFSGSILENIAFAGPDLRAEAGATGDIPQELKDAAEVACAREFIEEEEEGWWTHVGERGTGLSGGQRQRVAIARAVAAAPDVLILDDVTSALDAQTERRVVANLRSALSGKTLLIISQKVNTVMNADKIIVLEGGRVNGMGSHEELVRTNEIYREIHETQSMELRA